MAVFSFSQVMHECPCVPSHENIYLGTQESGEHVFVPVQHLFPIAIAGGTGTGKSALVRLLVSQFCSIGMNVLWLDPYYSPVDEADVDWAPVATRLLEDPMKTRVYPEIEYRLRQFAEVIDWKLAHPSPQDPLCVVVESVEAIINALPVASALLKRIFFEGRKVGIYLILTHQDAFSSLHFWRVNGNMMQFPTIYYLGGNDYMAMRFLGHRLPLIPQKGLGKGIAIAHNIAMKTPHLLSYPLLDTQALSDLFQDSSQEHHCPGAPIIPKMGTE